MRSVLLFFIAFLYSATCLCQDIRALVIGIDTYSPPQGSNQVLNDERQQFPDLAGCKNDAIAISSVLQSHFFVPQANIDSLYNTDATRENILGRFKRLLDRSKPNDIAFIFYAGHGSQVRNSLSKEADKKDETIVPSNAWAESGTDITDKELARIFNQFIDKGIKLIVVFDCCHSGSMSRSPIFNKPVTRYIKESSYDVKDATGMIPPEQRPDGDFLSISAAQDNELAVEQLDDNGIRHGAFTNAFLQAINQQSATASINNLFQATRAILKANGKKQEPVLAGSLKWRNKTLLYGDVQFQTNTIKIPVIGTNKQFVELGGGYAQELTIGNELMSVLSDNDTLLLRIDSEISITNSWASVIKGDKSKLRPGQLFEKSNWISNQAPLLKVYIPDYPFSETETQKASAIARKLKEQFPKQWIADLSVADPDLSFFYINGQCWLNRSGRNLEKVKMTDASSLAAIIRKSTFYFDIPPSVAFKNNLIKNLSSNKNIEVVSNSSEAQYVLFGTLNSEQEPGYGWRRTQAAAKDSLENMPVQTKPFPVKAKGQNKYESCADSLAKMAARLSKVRAWLQLTGPKTAEPFPYHLELKHKKTQAIIDTLPFKVDDEVVLHLVEENATIKSSKKKYVYAFIIDREGTMTLLYPDPRTGNVENRFPRTLGNLKKEDVELVSFSISIPTGTDTYFLLATDEPIQNYALLFNQTGTRSVNQGDDKNPLKDLINLGNETKMRNLSKTPKTWSLSKLTIKTIY